MTDPPARGKVLSIVGPGRSGTTLMARILGQCEGIVSAGELRFLWDRDLTQQRLCTCGETPAACVVWARVVLETLGVRPDEQPQRIPQVVRDLVHAQREVASRRNRIRVLRARSVPPKQFPEFEQLKGATIDLISALLDVTGSHLVVDASKRPEEAAIVAAAGRFDHFVLHMVRDPRGVVHSWRRKKLFRTADGSAQMASRTPLKTVSQWMENAVGAELLRRSIPDDRWLFVRYEDFVADPKGCVGSVLSHVQEDAPTPFLSGTAVRLGTDHVLSGNPDRFVTGTVGIRPDMEWKQRLGRAEQGLIVAATAPFLVRYGYLGSRARVGLP
jgi:hypothetical protein